MDIFKDIADPEVKGKIDGIKREIEDFVEWIFKHHKDFSRRGGKVIHDGVWGTHRYGSFEIPLINTPLIQRLRQIHQTAYTYLTYPSTQHSRFEHTLGVVAQIGNLFNALKERFKYSENDKEGLIDERLYRTLRTAAIFHDCGHGPLSHSTEEIYGNYDEIRLLKNFDPFKKAGPGEILSYLILDSGFFKNFLKEIEVEYAVDIDQDLMKKAIVGYVNEPTEHYKIDMLNGPFDADKLDYLFRDGHFSGLPLQIDLDRLWYSLDVNLVNKHRRLTIDWGGVSSLEQILFAKMTLYPAVYHHHKVRTCDCMLKGIIEYIQNNPELKLKKNDIDIDFSRVVHYLYFSDPEIFNLEDYLMKNEGLHKLVHNLQFRRLLKRAIVISRDTVIDGDIEKLDAYTKYREEPIYQDGLEYYRWLAKRIWEEAGKPGLFQELWVDCPDDPSFGEANETWISPLGKGLSPLRLTEFFKADKYADQYKHKKWRSHVFCRAEDTEKVATACVAVFKELYNIEFKSLAFHLCHIQPPSV